MRTRKERGEGEKEMEVSGGGRRVHKEHRRFAFIPIAADAERRENGRGEQNQQFVHRLGADPSAPRGPPTSGVLNAPLCLGRYGRRDVSNSVVVRTASRPKVPLLASTSALFVI
uniref:Uncharacterized protein n=1 Tax=Plectus sambesii TaxID=2011161 RepID=A0A914X238_9BILA